MFRKRIPIQPGYYWASHKDTPNVPEIVQLHLVFSFAYVTKMYKTDNYQVEEFTFGPKIVFPEKRMCPECKCDYRPSPCSRCQNAGEIWRVDASECYVQGIEGDEKNA
jgi:hypothetical protein